MTNSKYENIWQLLSTVNFKDEIPSEFYCIICKDVAIQPYGSLCGCRFCLSCISEYLKDDKRHCPGGKIKCLENYLEIDVTVSKDLFAVCSIGLLTVKCPNDLCDVRCDLENMGDHLRVCNMSTAKCPYENLGCQIGQMSMKIIKFHYNNEWFSHSHMLVEAIENLRNGVNELRKDNERKEIAIMQMKGQIDEQKVEIDELKDKVKMRENETEEMKEVKEMKIVLMKQQIDEQKIEIDEMKDKEKIRESETKEMKEIKEITIIQMKRQINDQEIEINELKNNLKEYIKTEIKELKETQSKIITEQLENIKKDILEMDVRGDHKKFLKHIRINQKNIEKEMNSIIMKVRDTQIYNEKEFIWKVDNFSKMTVDDRHWKRIILWRYSLKFYLSLWCREDNFRFYCTIMKGDLDDCLKWPIKHKITLSLINQETMKTHKCKEYQYETYENKSVFEKPKNKWNDFVGDDSFMTVKDIKDIPGLLLEDSLIVSFIIECQ